MTAPFDFKWFGTFTGPQSTAGAYNYDSLSLEGTWQTTLPTDLTFKLTDLAAVLFNFPGDYVGFYCNGVSTQLMTLAHSTGQIPTLNVQALTSIFNGNTIVNGSVIANGFISANGAVNLAGIGDVATYLTTLNSTKLDKSNKGFDISHPTKEGYRLRHICVEGPEDGPIYVRGKLEEGNVIKLPDYWDGLVDKESISVNLTPIGTYQELFVEKIEWGKNVIVKNNAGGPVRCYYQIWAARKYDDKLHVEYKGDTPADYPGDNTRFSIAGYDYDRR